MVVGGGGGGGDNIGSGGGAGGREFSQIFQFPRVHMPLPSVLVEQQEAPILLRVPMVLLQLLLLLHTDQS